MPDTVRTFIAIETSDAVHQRASELIATLAAAGAKVSWVKSHNLHITLKFLDEVPLREIPEVSAAMTAAAATIEPFDLEIGGAGAFPSVGRPKTLWLGTGAGAEPLVALHAALEKELARLKVRKDPRRYSAHLTLGRLRDDGPAVVQLSQLLRQNADFVAGRTRVARLVVFSSELTPQGPIYDAMARAPLGGK